MLQKDFDVYCAFVNGKHNERLLSDDALAIEHAQNGLLSELGELLNEFNKTEVRHKKPIDIEKVIDECGDVLWYLVAYARAIQSTERLLSIFTNSGENTERDMVYVIKSIIVYMATESFFSNGRHYRFIAFAALRLSKIVAHIAAFRNKTFDEMLREIMRRNMEKLTARHGDGAALTDGKIREAAKLVEQFNKWRRDNEGVAIQPNPTQLGDALDILLKAVKE